MLSAIFLINKDGIIIIEKQYREHIQRSQLDSACLTIRENLKNPAPSIIEDGDFSILLHQLNDIWVVGVCEGDDFALFATSILQYVGRLLNTLLKKGATENSIKEEYATVYQILDYAVDFGFPFLNEGNTIQTLLNRQPTDYAKGQRLQLDIARPWRSVGVKRLTNEILVDIIETIDLTVSPHGKTEFCHICGSVEVNSRLSANPTCKLILTNSTHYEDATFHRCIETDCRDSKVIPFVPPDGPFTLMKYRITAAQSTVPIFISPKFTWSKGNVTFEITAKPDQSLPKALENVEIRFELPDGVLSPSLAPTYGRSSFDTSTHEVVWTIGAYSKKDPIVLKGSASTESDFDLGGRFPVVVAKFVTIGIAPSGFKVEKLEIENIDYKAFKGIKYAVQSGSYEFRSGI